MEIVLVVAVLIVAAAVLFVALTLGSRTRQSAGPLIDEAAKDISGRIEELKAQLTAIAGELEHDRDQTRLENRKIQGRLDHADSRTGSIANRLLAEMEAIRRLDEQISTRQDQLSEDLHQLDDQVAQLRADQQASASVLAGPAPAAAITAAAAVAGRLYAERLQFSMIRIQQESVSQSGRRYRIQAERDVAELPVSQFGGPGDASALTERAGHDDGFRARLGEAASGYLAAKWADPAFAAVTERWVTKDTFPETAAAEVCNRLGHGLAAIAEKPLAKTGTELRLPGPEAAAGIVLQPVTEAAGQATRFLEITGVVVGVATGLHPVALATAKMLVHDQFHDWVARGLREAARTVFDGPAGPAPAPGPGEPATLPHPAHPADGPGQAGPAPASPASDTDTWWELPSAPGPG
jgi:uncharacterized protein YoxC